MRGGQRAGAGRPRDPDARRHAIQVRVTDDELARVKQTAEHYGLSVSDLVRKSLGLAVLLLVMLVGCVTPPMPTNALADPPAGADEALDLAVAAWADELLGGRRPAPPAVVWFEGECLDYPEHQLEHVPCMIGRYWSPNGPGLEPEIHLLVSERPSDSALAHELLHWGLDRLGDLDAAHAGPRWDLVASVESTLREGGL
jgi:hypothetical protein